MFLVWYDDLMQVSGFICTAYLRKKFVEHYGKEAWLNWIGYSRFSPYIEGKK